MKIMKFFISLTFFFAMLVSCSVTPQEIDFGTDACDFCKMNIVDKQHAAQYVTKKGKQYKFDAIECMVNDINEQDHEKKLSIILVSNYGSDGEMIIAEDATYLICQKIKSPMGAFLSAYKNASDAEKTKAELGGEIYTWDSLKLKFKGE